MIEPGISHCFDEPAIYRFAAQLRDVFGFALQHPVTQIVRQFHNAPGIIRFQQLFFDVFPLHGHDHAIYMEAVTVNRILTQPSDLTSAISEKRKIFSEICKKGLTKRSDYDIITMKIYPKTLNQLLDNQTLV